MTGGPERRSPNWWASRPARSASGSASSATRGWRNSAPCTTRAIRAASDRPRSSGSSRRSPRGCSTTPSKSAPGSQETLGVAYSISGIKDLLRRIGASYHKVSGFFWKADVEEQKKFVRKHRRHKREAGPTTRRYFVDACHPVWGVDLLVFLLAAGGAAVLRGRGQRSEAAEHPRGLQPRRSRLRGPPADEGEHHRRAIRQAAGGVAGEAPRHREVPPLPGQCEVLQQAVCEGVVGGAIGSSGWCRCRRTRRT